MNNNSLLSKIYKAVNILRSEDIGVHDTIFKLFYLVYDVEAAYFKNVSINNIQNMLLPYVEEVHSPDIDSNKIHEFFIENGYIYTRIDYNSIYIYPNNTNPTIMYIDSDSVKVFSFYECDEFCQEIKKNLDKKPKKHAKNEVGVLVRSCSGHYINDVTFDKMNINIKNTYNDDLPVKEIDNFIKNENTGLCLFYGEPGTGKSTFIKYLIQKYDNTQFIILNAELLYDSTSNSLLSEFISNKNAIYVIEDCEKLLVSRNSEPNPIISAFLNMTDGILAEIIQCKFICTFNTELENIDDALLRKGRLKLKYEFKKLDSKKVNKLLKTENSSDMRIADVIFNKKENDFSKKKVSRIGF